MHRFRNDIAAPDGPLTPDGFGPLLDACGPFEAAPRIAIAVSGGADSLALCLLAAGWAAARGGRVAALTVDHGLRPESGAEAAQVARWMAARGVDHHILHWRDGRSEHGEIAGNLQQAARRARYDLLTGWCRDHGILHLLTAHHRDDQAETFLLRLARGSGVDGLSAMAPVTLAHGVRLLRPLLGVAATALRDYLRGQGQGWIEDPSNDRAEFARVRMRQAMPGFAAAGLDPTRIAAAAADLGRARRALESGAANLLARTVRLEPLGHAWLDSAVLAAAPAETGLRALRQLVQTVGGGDFPPREDRLTGLHDALAKGLDKGRTLGGCQFAPVKTGQILVLREARRLPPALAVAAGQSVIWDARFAVRAPGDGELRPLPVGAGRTDGVPNRVLPTLPGFWRAGALIAIPAQLIGGALEIAFRPVRPLTG